MQAKEEAVQAKQDAEQAKQAAATLMEEYERRKLSAEALESASSGLGLGQTIGVAVGCSLAIVLLVLALGFFVLKRPWSSQGAFSHQRGVFRRPTQWWSSPASLNQMIW